MKRAPFHVIGIMVMLLVGQRVLAETAKPNVLLIIADDLGDRLACYGDTLAVTPHLDALSF